MGQLKILEKKNQHLLKIIYCPNGKGKVLELGYGKLGASFQNFQEFKSLWLRKVNRERDRKWKTCSSIFTIILLEFLAIHVYLPQNMQASFILSQPATVKLISLLSPLHPSGPTPLEPTLQFSIPTCCKQLTIKTQTKDHTRKQAEHTMDTEA